MSAKAKKPPARTLRMRRLAAELRRLRDAARLTREDVTEATRINNSTLYRIETAQARPQVRTLHTLCDIYQVGDQERENLIGLVKNATQERWLDAYPTELPAEYSNYILFESEASLIRNFESLFVPGLLQTEDYARAVINGTLPHATTDQIEARVRARLQRQDLLNTSDPLSLHAVVDEAALRREVGGRHVMREQLLHLAAMADLPHVTIQVIDVTAGAHPGMPGSFVLIDFPETDPAVVYVDSMAGDLFLEGETDVDRYSDTMDHLIDIALTPEQTRKFITDLSEGIKDKT